MQILVEAERIEYTQQEYDKEMAEAWNIWGTMCRLALLAYVICNM